MSILFTNWIGTHCVLQKATTCSDFHVLIAVNELFPKSFRENKQIAQCKKCTFQDSSTYAKPVRRPAEAFKFWAC